MHFSLPWVKCLTAPPNFQQCFLNCAQWFDLIMPHSAVLRSLIDCSDKCINFVGWALNLKSPQVIERCSKGHHATMYCHHWVCVFYDQWDYRYLRFEGKFTKAGKNQWYSEPNKNKKHWEKLIPPMCFFFFLEYNSFSNIVFVAYRISSCSMRPVHSKSLSGPSWNKYNIE